MAKFTEQKQVLVFLLLTAALLFLVWMIFWWLYREPGHRSIPERACVTAPLLSTAA